MTNFFFLQMLLRFYPLAYHCWRQISQLRDRDSSLTIETQVTYYNISAVATNARTSSPQHELRLRYFDDFLRVSFVRMFSRR